MKKIWTFLKEHLRADFHPGHYGTVALILFVAVALNFTFNFEKGYLDNLLGFRKLAGYFTMYALIYFATVFSFVHFHNQRDILRQGQFWVKAMFGIFILSLDSSLPFLYPVIESTLDRQLHTWAFKVAINLVSFLTVFIPVIFFYRLVERREHSVYGLRPVHFDARPYWTMLLIMAPLIVAVSFHPSFIRQYPMYDPSKAHEYLNVGEWFTVVTYEIAYALDFITVELFFRGFMVLAIAPFLNRGAVLSMAAIYCALHFGKPMGEAISSVFGGFLLGVIAYQTKSIWGGVIVHIGIAWMMEVVAFVQKQLASSL